MRGATGANDTLTIDYQGGTFGVPITFHGGAGGADTLVIRGGQFDAGTTTPTAAETRVILTVRTEGAPDQTAFFDPDSAITRPEADDLLHRIEGALREGGVEALTLSGSSPSPTTHEAL